MEDFIDLFDRFSKLDLNRIPLGDQISVLVAFNNLVEIIKPIIEKYEDKSGETNDNIKHFIDEVNKIRGI